MSFFEMETDSMDAIVDSLPSIREERPVDVPAERERAAFFGVRRDDRRDMLQYVSIVQSYRGSNDMVHIDLCTYLLRSAIFGTNSTVTST